MRTTSISNSSGHKTHWAILLVTFLLIASNGFSQPADAKLIEPLPVLQSNTDLSVVEDSLSPNEIISGESVPLQLEVFNSNSSVITLNGTSSISFTLQNEITYSANLLSQQILPSQQQTKLFFSPVDIPDVSTSENLTIFLILSGTDSLGAAYHQSISLVNAGTILPNSVGLVELLGTFEPTEPSRQSRLIFWVKVENTTACPLQIGSNSEMIIRSTSKWEATMPLLEPVVIPANSTAQVNFGFFAGGILWSSIPDELPNGTYDVSFRLFGTNQCDGTSFQSHIDNSDTIQAYPWEGTLDGTTLITSDGGIFSQFGGVYQNHVWIGGTDPHQILLEIEVDEHCDDHLNGEVESCSVLPQGTYEVISNSTKVANKFYTYGKTMRYYPIRLELSPTPEMLDTQYPWGFGISYVGLKRFQGGGVGIIEGVADYPLFTFVEREARFTHTGIETQNTFVQTGQTNQVVVNVNNPESGFPKSNLEVKVGSSLLLEQNGSDGSLNFSTVLRSIGVSVPQQNDLGILFDVTPSDEALLGRVNIGASVSSEGAYLYYDRFSYQDFAGIPYVGPDQVIIEGTSQYNPANGSFFYVVDQQPLVLLQQNDTVGNENKSVLLPIQNSSSWDFTIEPGSYLDLPVTPVEDLIIKTSIGNFYGFYGKEIAQSIIPENSFDVKRVSFTVNLPGDSSGLTTIDNLIAFEIVKANTDGTISNNLIATQDFLIPAGSPIYGNPVTINLENVKLLKGQKYFIKLIFPETGSVFSRLPDQEDTYTQGSGSYKYLLPNGNTLWSETNLDFNFLVYAERIYLRANSTLTESQTIDPFTNSSVPFQFETPVDVCFDGGYVPEVVLKGTTTTPSESFVFRQELSSLNATITIDNTAPAAQVMSLPTRTLPSTTVSWSAVDLLSAVENYDVQVQIDGGDWIDWLSSTADAGAVYPSQAGHVYAFRARASDEMGNLGTWSEPVTTEVSTEPYTNIALSPLPLSPGNYQGDTTISFLVLPLDGFPLTQTYFAVDGTPQQLYESPIVVSGAGNHTIEYWSVDQANHNETHKYYTFTTINIPPTIVEGDYLVLGMYEDVPNSYHRQPVLNATDPEISNTLTWRVLSGPSHGNASIQTTGQEVEFSYISELNYYGTDTFIVEVSDGFGGTDTIEVQLYISAVNDCPVITGGESISVTMSEDGYPTPFTLSLNAIDVEGDNLSWKIFYTPSHGIASVLGTGGNAEVAYGPIQDYHGGDFFSIQVADASNCRDDIWVSVLIESVFDGPEITIVPVDPDGPFIAGLPIEFNIVADNSDGDNFNNLDLDFTVDQTGSVVQYCSEMDGQTNGCVAWTMFTDLTAITNTLITGETAFTPELPVFRVIFPDDGGAVISATLRNIAPTLPVSLDADEQSFILSGGFTLTGTFSMQGRSARQGIPINLSYLAVEGFYPDVTAETINHISNNLVLSGINGGDWLLTTQQERYLNLVDANLKLLLVDSPIVLPAIQLIGGNAYWWDEKSDIIDNTIDLSDASLVGSQFGTSGFTSSYGNNGDCNFDGYVSVHDLALVGGNFGMTNLHAYGPSN